LSTPAAGSTRPRAAPIRRPRLTVLGAGPAGVGAAFLLARERRADVVVLEREGRVGGNAGSFDVDGVRCDYGSHRLHAASAPHVMAMIREALGDDLVLRPRHGRIRLKERWIHFPLSLPDLVTRLPRGFAAALLLDAACKPLRRKPSGEETFASVLRQGLGPTISEHFYYPYVRKLWALPPEELAVTLARRRVSGSSVGKILMKIARQMPGFRGKLPRGFYYPRRGFGEISEALRTRAEDAGASFELGAPVGAIEHRDGRVVAVRWEKDGATRRRECDGVWSTLPITTLVRLMEPAAPVAVLEAARRIRYRGLILIYLTLEQDRFTEYDAHYFPELAIPIARLSEPKNYSGTSDPRGVTVLCAELPSDPGDAWWSLSDEELGARLKDWLAGVELPIRGPVRRTLTRRLAYAYPVYDRGFETSLELMDRWVGGVQGLLTFGRQGLFAHDNTHHALEMAHAAVDCLREDGGFDSAAWQRYRQQFESHVVED
jgi:protoporphyrinogen oxidase